MQRAAPVHIGALPPYPPPLEAALSTTKLRVQYEGSVEQVLAKVSELYVANQDAERKNRRDKWIGGLLVVVGFFAILIIIGVIILPFGIWLLVRKREGDVEDRQLETVSGLLTALGAELRPGRPVQLQADLRSYEQSNATSVGGAQQYEHWWLHLTFTVMDGTGVALDIVQHVKRKQRRKNKYTVQNDRIIEVITVRLRPPGGQAFSAASQRRWQQQAVGPLTLRRAQVEPRSARFVFATRPNVRTNHRYRTTNLSHQVNSRTALLAVTGAYRMVKGASPKS